MRKILKNAAITIQPFYSLAGFLVVEQSECTVAAYPTVISVQSTLEHSGPRQDRKQQTHFYHFFLTIYL
jgi:hypothetical protein